MEGGNWGKEMVRNKMDREGELERKKREENDGAEVGGKEFLSRSLNPAERSCPIRFYVCLRSSLLNVLKYLWKQLSYKSNTAHVTSLKHYICAEALYPSIGLTILAPGLTMTQFLIESLYSTVQVIETSFQLHGHREKAF